MKKIIFLFILAGTFACNTSKKNNKETTKTEIENTTETTESNKTEEEEEILVGNISCKDLEKPPYENWFVENFNNHMLDTATLTQLKPLLSNVHIKVFMGTWCSDSQREVPALHKILEEAGFDEKNLQIVAVDRDKVTPQGFEKNMDIQYVPTIIFYKNKKEVGRIVESPVETLEKDMLTILSGKPYKHTYQE